MSRGELPTKVNAKTNVGITSVLRMYYVGGAFGGDENLN